jgi:hypothetical protein
MRPPKESGSHGRNGSLRPDKRSEDGANSGKLMRTKAGAFMNDPLASPSPATLRHSSPAATAWCGLVICHPAWLPWIACSASATRVCDREERARRGGEEGNRADAAVDHRGWARGTRAMKSAKRRPETSSRTGRARADCPVLIGSHTSLAKAVGNRTTTRSRLVVKGLIKRDGSPISGSKC